MLYDKDSWILLDRSDDRLHGVGEISIIKDLSPDDEQTIDQLLESGIFSSNHLHSMPAFDFGCEMVEKSLSSDDPFRIFESDFTRGLSGLPINGLIWMGTKSEMFQRIKEKLDSGYTCLKLKIGAIEFEHELSLLKYVRSHFSEQDVMLRLDANGAFSPDEVQVKLEALSEYGIDSIEQPIRAGQWEQMSKVCALSPISIALDEELIGINRIEDKKRLIESIQPDYLILKPSLLGGFNASDEWIGLAEAKGIGWWATSALESNIGLNAIAQWCFTKDVSLYQGLGTGQLYSNNFNSPLHIDKGYLYYNPEEGWDSLIPYLKKNR